MDNKVKNYKIPIVLFYFFMIYKIGLEFGYWYILRKYYADSVEYTFDFNIYKYILGFLTIFLIFMLIRHNDGRVSTFYLELHYVLAIIPITVVYSFGNKETLYYLGVCIGYILAIIIVQLKTNLVFDGSEIISLMIIICFCLITIIVYLDMIVENGIPQLRALNIFSVYDYRGEFQINKYVGYLYRWQVVVINPFMIINGLQKKNKSLVGIFTILQFAAYLYTTQKTILFIIPLIYGVYFLAKFKRFNVLVYSIFSVSITLSAILASINYNLYKIFSLFGRRVLLLPANLKFLYYDFFTNHENIGLAGTLWGKFLDVESPYELGVGNLISKYYFNLPETNSNTGFLAEGYYMFGYLGILLAVVLFAFLLKCLDFCENRNGFAFTIGISIYSLFMLNDTSLIDSILFGNITILLVILIFYKNSNKYTKNIKCFRRAKCLNQL